MAALYEVKQIITGLSACFPDWKPPNLAATMKEYEEALAGYPVDLLKCAADRCRDVCIFFPKIAEIRKALVEIHTADVPNTSAGYEEKVPISPKMQHHMDDFRQHMVDSGKWKEARRSMSREE